MVNNIDEYDEKIMKLTDKYTYGLNSSLELLDFYSNYHQCIFIMNDERGDSNMDDCNETKILTTSGICQTYLYDNKSKIDNVKKTCNFNKYAFEGYG